MIGFFSVANIQKLAGFAVTIVLAAILWLLLTLYGNLSFKDGITGSITYTAILASSGYFYRYITDYLKAIQAKIAIALLAQFVSLAGTFAIISALGGEDRIQFASNIVLYLVFGLLCWTILEMWYNRPKIYNRAEESEQECSAVPEKGEIIDHIPVKEGSQIHIVRLEEIQYIQAYGDYVMLYTDTGRHIKEQTMKYFEYHLPAYFVRVHRSSIVNSSKITRAELYGKETYNIQLKSGASLRASTNGFKLLKERLSL